MVRQEPGGTSLLQDAGAPSIVEGPSLRKRLGLGALSLLLAAVLWLPSLHLLYRVDATPSLEHRGLPPGVEAAAAGLLRAWAGPGTPAVAALRRSDPEWDLIGRSFLAWSLCEMALREPSRRAGFLRSADAILEGTLRDEKAHSFRHFLLPYASGVPYALQPPRSLFVDSEIALGLGMRLLVAEDAEDHRLLRARIREIEARFEQAPAPFLESYPEECWLYDHAVAFAAMAVFDALDGGDHRPLYRRWKEAARKRLLDPGTGLLAASFTPGGRVLDGPEGSSLWMACHGLRLLDPEFAQGQYRRSREALSRRVLGFAVAREWPAGKGSAGDIDAGAVIPLLEASPSSSGLALVAAASFGDRDLLEGLQASLEFAGFPLERDGARTYAAGNALGDAVALYARVLGPGWDEVARRTRR